MSTEMHVVVGERVPERGEWQAAIDRLGIPLQLDPGLSLTQAAGISPCKLRGADSRLELSDAPAAELLASFPTLAKAAPRPVAKAITFRWGDDARECAAALGAAAALLAGFPGVAYCPVHDVVYDSDGLRTEFASVLAESG
jgi:hypothetical protein